MVENRIEAMQKIVDGYIAKCPEDKRRGNRLHAYGVSLCAALLALKRGYSPELATVAGLLHDISYIRLGTYENHCIEGARMAANLMEGLYAQAEIDTVYTAIALHDNASEVHEPLDEILKDADVLYPYMYNLQKKANPAAVPRLKKSFEELGLAFEIA